MAFCKIKKNRSKLMTEENTRFLVFHLYYLKYIEVTLKLYTSIIKHYNVL